MLRFEAWRQRVLPSKTARNFRLGVANGVLFSLADALIDANLVLALFVRELGASQAYVGLLPSLKNGGFLLPQLLVAGRIRAMPLKLPLYRRAAVARSVAFLLMTAVIFGANALGASLTLLLLCITYTMYNLMGGSGSLAFQDVVAKVIPPRRRGSFFSSRLLFGGLLAFFVAGPVVRALLSQDAPLPFPANYGTLWVISLVCMVLAFFLFGSIEEPALSMPGTRHTLRQTLQSAPYLFRRDVDFRRFIVSRIWGRVGAIADPFYIIYAREALQISPRYVGIYLSLRVVTAALSNLYWGRVADQQGNRRLLVLTTSVAALVPVVALLLPHVFVPGSEGLAWAFSAIFLLIGLSIDGTAIASSTYLLEVAPETERTTYAGIANTVLGVFTFVPVLGGLLLGALGNNYALVFAIGALASFGACGAALRLREVREVRDDMRQAQGLVAKDEGRGAGGEERGDDV